MRNDVFFVVRYTQMGLARDTSGLRVLPACGTRHDGLPGMHDNKIGSAEGTGDCGVIMGDTDYAAYAVDAVVECIK
ncbi:hypothetical protein NQZ79_g6673 [Umbelopsis isabellina]|nr:hypothetical protein NQZ79_g6673 [Umbelopsis isabellina]